MNWLLCEPNIAFCKDFIILGAFKGDITIFAAKWIKHLTGELNLAVIACTFNDFYIFDDLLVFF